MELVKELEKLKELHSYFLELRTEFPGLYREFLRSLPQSEGNESPVGGPGGVPLQKPQKVTDKAYHERIADYLAENPRKSTKEIAEGTGIKETNISAVIYSSGVKGRFTSEDDPDSKSSRPRKLWSLASVGQVSRVGNREIKCKAPRATTTQLIMSHLEEKRRKHRSRDHRRNQRGGKDQVGGSSDDCPHNGPRGPSRMVILMSKNRSTGTPTESPVLSSWNLRRGQQ